MIDSPEVFPGHGLLSSGRSLAPPRRLAGMAASPPALVRRLVTELHELERQQLRDRVVDLATHGLALADVPDDEGAPDRRSNLLAQLRAAIATQACALRARGEPPERMLRAVKATLSDALARAGWWNPATGDRLMGRVVRWSIEAYYDR